MKNLVFCVVSCFLLAGCGEYIPRTVFEIETVSGEIIKLACPVIENGRSTFTYFIVDYCTIYK